MVGLMTIILLMLGNRSSLMLVPLAWLWFVGGNLLIGITRFEHFVARAVATAPTQMRQSNFATSFRR
jgi:hypothetical protein